jgi:hypothetical protein
MLPGQAAVAMLQQHVSEYSLLFYCHFRHGYAVAQVLHCMYAV